jgi:hypothetical protein
MNLSAEISVGEFLDKITILEIKSERIKDESKLTNIHKELETLRNTWQASAFSQQEIGAEIAELKGINEQLWVIEDDIRIQESQALFDQKFIELARAVYVVNDQRATVKRTINIKVGSELVEEKSYQDYAQKS